MSTPLLDVIQGKIRQAIQQALLPASWPPLAPLGDPLELINKGLPVAFSIEGDHLWHPRAPWATSGAAFWTTLHTAEVRGSLAVLSRVRRILIPLLTSAIALTSIPLTLTSTITLRWAAAILLWTVVWLALIARLTSVIRLTSVVMVTVVVVLTSVVRVRVVVGLTSVVRVMVVVGLTAVIRLVIIPLLTVVLRLTICCLIVTSNLLISPGFRLVPPISTWQVPVLLMLTTLFSIRSGLGLMVVALVGCLVVTSVLMIIAGLCRILTSPHLVLPITDLVLPVLFWHGLVLAILSWHGLVLAILSGHGLVLAVLTHLLYILEMLSTDPDVGVSIPVVGQVHSLAGCLLPGPLLQQVGQPCILLTRCLGRYRMLLLPHPGL